MRKPITAHESNFCFEQNGTWLQPLAALKQARLTGILLNPSCFRNIREDVKRFEQPERKRKALAPVSLRSVIGYDFRRGAPKDGLMVRNIDDLRQDVRKWP